MSFFDAQPAGRLLNRFSKDTEATDVQVQETIAWTVTSGRALALSPLSLFSELNGQPPAATKLTVGCLKASLA